MFEHVIGIRTRGSITLTACSQHLALGTVFDIPTEINKRKYEYREVWERWRERGEREGKRGWREICILLLLP